MVTGKQGLLHTVGQLHILAYHGCDTMCELCEAHTGQKNSLGRELRMIRVKEYEFTIMRK